MQSKEIPLVSVDSLTRLSQFLTFWRKLTFKKSIFNWACFFNCFASTVISSGVNQTIDNNNYHQSHQTIHRCFRSIADSLSCFSARLRRSVRYSDSFPTVLPWLHKWAQVLIFQGAADCIASNGCDLDRLQPVIQRHFLYLSKSFIAHNNYLFSWPWANRSTWTKSASWSSEQEWATVFFFLIWN